MRKMKICAISFVCLLVLSGCGSASSSRLSNGNKVEDTINQQIADAENEDTVDDDVMDADVTDTDAADLQEDIAANEDADAGKEEAPEEKNDEAIDYQYEIGSVDDDEIDIDLTDMNSDMVYSTVFQMVNEPDSYAGKKVKMGGQYYSDWYDATEQYYYYVMIADAASCCSQGLEFVLGDGTLGREKYPEDGAELEVVGEFETYDEVVEGKTYTYCHLKNAEIVSVE